MAKIFDLLELADQPLRHLTEVVVMLTCTARIGRL
jgi:hypothetical protein